MFDKLHGCLLISVNQMKNFHDQTVSGSLEKLCLSLERDPCACHLREASLVLWGIAFLLWKEVFDLSMLTFEESYLFQI